MWITLQGKHINFSIIQSFYKEGKALYLTNMEGRVTYFTYETEQKCNQVLKYLVDTLAIKE